MERGLQQRSSPLQGPFFIGEAWPIVSETEVSVVVRDWSWTKKPTHRRVKEEVLCLDFIVRTEKHDIVLEKRNTKNRSPGKPKKPKD